MPNIENIEVIEKLKILRQKMQTIPLPPNFERDFELYSTKNIDKEYRYGFNCYSYAMRFPTEYSLCERYFHGYYVPGFLTTKTFKILDPAVLIQLFNSDCDALGLAHSPAKVDDPLEPDSYKIEIFYSRSEKDFHFLRQNDDGSWSSKRSWEAIPIIEKYPTRDITTYIPIDVQKISKRK